MIKVVVFDLDDTLYSYKDCNNYAMNQLEIYVIDKYGISRAHFIELFNKSREIVKTRLGNVSSSHNRLLYMQTFLELLGQKPTIDALSLYDIYWNSLLDKMTLFPYVTPLLKELHAKNIKVGVLTDLTAHIQHRKIKKLGLEVYIDILVTSEEAGVEKPNFRAFSLLMEKCNVSKKEILMIGDSQKKDIDGAKNAGIDGILFSPTMSCDMHKRVMRYIDDKENDY